jgi:hypothetical protein
MTIRWPLLLCVLLLVACATPATDRLSKPDVPPPAMVDVMDSRFFIDSADPFRWMEEPARETEMVAWVRAMSAASTAQLRAPCPIAPSSPACSRNRPRPAFNIPT